MRSRFIEKKDYNLILEMDKKVYPTSSPVTKQTIASWYINNPEFGMIYENRGKVVGTSIAMPLNMVCWRDLVNGKLFESEMNKKTIFNNSRDKKIGIHVYHIENLSNEKRLYKRVLEDLSNLVDNLKNKNPQLKVGGFSGLCVTKQGINLFEKKLKCSERDYKCPEYIFQKDGKLVVLDEAKDSFGEALAEGYKFVNKCKMLVSYPSEESVVWNYFK